MYIPFNKPHIFGEELANIKEAVEKGCLSGDGYFTKLCHNWLEAETKCRKALLTHSCTAALEMTALLSKIEPGDEIIMPSYTFVSTANAFVLRGGVPVFVDICSDTMNIDESLIEPAITGKTKAIVPVHYAGVACEMDYIMEIAKTHNLIVIEDSAQGIGSVYRERPLGSIGHFGTLSFHETKNIISGEGGALLINSSLFEERAEIIWEKGTNRKKFFRGEIDKYSWVDIGSSYLPSDILAAFLYAQMEKMAEINKQRKISWNHYYDGLKPLADEKLIELPVVPCECEHNAHMFYIKTNDLQERSSLIEFLKENGVCGLFHYVPLHSSKAGLSYGRFSGEDRNTTRESERLLRLPLYFELSASQIEYIINLIFDYYSQK